jgi:hypothetical protein
LDRFNLFPGSKCHVPVTGNIAFLLSLCFYNLIVVLIKEKKDFTEIRNKGDKIVGNLSVAHKLQFCL